MPVCRSQKCVGTTQVQRLGLCVGLGLHKDEMLRWHAVFCGTQLGKRIAGQEIDRRNNPAGKKSRAEAIHGDLMTLLAAQYDESGKAQDEGASSDSTEEDEDESSAQA